LTLSYISFGSNLGDRHTTLAGAYSALTEDSAAIRPLLSSHLYETAPVGGPDDQGRFLNSVLKIETTLPPEALLVRCHKIEHLYRRERIVRWGARTLDLDLLFYGDQVIKTETLELPHPRLHLRRFVLVPLADVAAEFVHPILGESVRELLARLPPEPGDVYPVAETWTEAKASQP